MHFISTLLFFFLNHSAPVVFNSEVNRSGSKKAETQNEDISQCDMRSFSPSLCVSRSSFSFLSACFPAGLYFGRSLPTSRSGVPVLPEKLEYTVYHQMHRLQWPTAECFIPRPILHHSSCEICSEGFIILLTSQPHCAALCSLKSLSPAHFNLGKRN